MKTKIITLICLLGLAMGSASAIEEAPFVMEKNQQEKQDTTEANKVYTNDVHSVFSLKDCVNVAITHNPDIRASLYNEQAYKSKACPIINWKINAPISATGDIKSTATGIIQLS